MRAWGIFFHWLTAAAVMPSSMASAAAVPAKLIALSLSIPYVKRTAWESKDP